MVPSPLVVALLSAALVSAQKTFIIAGGGTAGQQLHTYNCAQLLTALFRTGRRSTTYVLPNMAFLALSESSLQSLKTLRTRSSYSKLVKRAYPRRVPRATYSSLLPAVLTSMNCIHLPHLRIQHHSSPNIIDFTKISTLPGSSVDWNYRSEPATFAVGQTFNMTRGKVLGCASLPIPLSSDRC